MTNATQNDPRKNFVPRYMPWLLAGVMLVVYWATLNHWVSLYNLDYVASVSGWKWQPEVYSPLTYLVTYPLRWLPTAQVPLVLNGLSAVAAAVVLGLLARSVALLPQDRTEVQRIREASHFSFLTISSSWLPPVLAVLICGLQFTFWQYATNFTGDLITLVIFAFVVWSLLEYRLDEREGRLYLAVGLYGAGMAQDSGLIGFAPLLLVALIWIRGLSFFNSFFLLRLIGCGLAGLSLYLLMPTLAVFAGKLPANEWWQGLKFNLSSQWTMIRYFFVNTSFRHAMALISLTSLLPLLMLSIRWKTSFGDRSRIGTQIMGLMMHLVYGILFGICVWGAFDPPFSAHRQGFGLPCLTFYFLAALSVGYYSGYFLLVSKAVISRRSRRTRPLYVRALSPVVLTLMVALALVVTAGLIWKNGPAIQSVNSGIFKKYAGLMAASLPRTGGILMADSETGPGDTPRRLYFIQEELAQEGRDGEYVPVDTFALNSPDYHRFLHKKYPRQWPLVVDEKAKGALDPRGLLGLIDLLAKTNALYYLHPSFGYYFEAFYMEPHGLVYELKPLPEDTLLPRRPDSRLQAENEAFWTQAENEALGPLVQEVTPKDAFAARHSLGQKIMTRLHVKPEVNLNAQLAGQYYSRSLNYWGVQAQQAGALAPAAAHFETAQKLNLDNFAARINLGFNQDLRARKPVALDLSKTSSDQWGKYRSWTEIVTADGPFDEPSFCYEDGTVCLQGSLLHQAIAAFTRVRELIPNNLPTLLSLGELYVFCHRPELALAALEEPLAHPEHFGLNDTNSIEINMVASAAYIQQTNLAHGIRLLEREIAHHPDDETLLGVATQVYLTQGLFTNALQVINLRLATVPNDASWLFSQGYAFMRLNQYPQAIASLTRVIELQTNSYDALFNRAVAYLNSDQLEPARIDYQHLQQAYPKSYQVAYGLGEIAWRQKATNDAIRNYGVYLDNAPTNTAEFQVIHQRLADLRGKSP